MALLQTTGAKETCYLSTQETSTKEMRGLHAVLSPMFEHLSASMYFLSTRTSRCSRSGTATRTPSSRGPGLRAGCWGLGAGCWALGGWALGAACWLLSHWTICHGGLSVQTAKSRTPSYRRRRSSETLSRDPQAPSRV